MEGQQHNGECLLNPFLGVAPDLEGGCELHLFRLPAAERSGTHQCQRRASDNVEPKMGGSKKSWERLRRIKGVASSTEIGHFKVVRAKSTTVMHVSGTVQSLTKFVGGILKNESHLCCRSASNEEWRRNAC